MLSRVNEASFEKWVEFLFALGGISICLWYNPFMKILVIGDTHGKLNKVSDIMPKLTGLDLIIHTGDYQRDGELLQELYHLPVVSVPGNCDGSYSQNDFEIVETEWGNIFVAHGHAHHVGYKLDTLMYAALEQNCKAAVFGHTHCNFVNEIDGFHLLNPGSLTQPRDGSGGSYGIIRTSDDSFTASIVYYNTVMGGGSKGSGSGFLKNMLNYVDRF